VCLRDFRLRRRTLLKISSATPNLAKLDLHGCVGLTDDSLSQLAFNQLQEFALIQPSNDFERVLFLAPTLYMVTKEHMKVTWRGLEDFLITRRHATNLVSLSLGFLAQNNNLVRPSPRHLQHSDWLQSNSDKSKDSPPPLQQIAKEIRLI